jgi:hypothetical protein
MGRQVTDASPPQPTSLDEEWRDSVDRAAASMTRADPNRSVSGGTEQKRDALDVVRLAAALDNVDRDYQPGWTPAHYARAIAAEYARLEDIDE